jgi:hypothetical protein
MEQLKALTFLNYLPLKKTVVDAIKRFLFMMFRQDRLECLSLADCFQPGKMHARLRGGDRLLPLPQM